MSDNKTFRAQVKSKLAELDMTQIQLAQQLGIDRKYLNQIITGQRKGEKQRAAIIKLLNIRDI